MRDFWVLAVVGAAWAVDRQAGGAVAAAEGMRVEAAYQRLKTVPIPSEYDDSPAVVAPLGKYVNRVSPPGGRRSLEVMRLAVEAAEENRKLGRISKNGRLRRRLRRTAQRFTESIGVRKCGHVRVLDSGVTLARSRAGTAGFRGLATCGSVWECPECQQKIMRTRAKEIRQLITAHRATGGDVLMLTLTGPHDLGDELVPLRRHVSNAWRYMQTGKGWKAWKARLGVVGTVRALEVNHGPNGWHPHTHTLLLVARPVETGEFEEWLYTRWAKAFTRKDKETGKCYRTPTREHGLTLVPCHKEEYLAKLGLVDEMTRGSWKKPRGFVDLGYRTPFEILRDLDAHGRPGDLALWREYANGIRGARQLTYSKKLREKYDLRPEQTELEIIEESEHALTEEIALIVPAEWDGLVRDDLQLQGDLIDAAGLGDRDRVQALLDQARGLDPLPF